MLTRLKDTLANWLTDGELYSTRLKYAEFTEAVKGWQFIINETSPKHPQMARKRTIINKHLDNNITF